MTIQQALSLAALLLARGWYIFNIICETIDPDTETAVYSITAERYGKRQMFEDETDMELAWIERLEEHALYYLTHHAVKE